MFSSVLLYKHFFFYLKWQQNCALHALDAASHLCL